MLKKIAVTLATAFVTVLIGSKIAHKVRTN